MNCRNCGAPHEPHRCSYCGSEAPGFVEGFNRGVINGVRLRAMPSKPLVFVERFPPAPPPVHYGMPPVTAFDRALGVGFVWAATIFGLLLAGGVLA